MTQQFQQTSSPFGDGVVAQRPHPPTQNAGWAVATVIFFWPLAFSAFNSYARVLPLWLVGDYEGAQRESDQVKKLGKIALLICAVLTVLILVVYGVIVVAAFASIDSASSIRPYPGYR